ncbi:MAG TPA: M14 family metallocarboxypeptidase, partial [Nitrospiria bacterium]
MEKPVRRFEEVAEAVGRAENRIPRLEVRDLGPVSTSSGIYPMYLLHLDPDPSAPTPPLTVYLSGGIHGDEPAGVWALLEFLERYNGLDGPYPHTRFTILPCLNPGGFERNTRHNADDIDLNRQFRRDSPPPEVDLVKKAVGGCAFDLTMEFHEDVDTPGFYLYELTQNGERSWGREIINRISEKYPVNRNEVIEETSAVDGLIHRSGEHDDFHHFIRS